MKSCLNCNKEFKHKHTIQKFCCLDCAVLFRYHQDLPIIYCCLDCGNQISKPTALRGKGRCKSCSRKGKLSWNKKIGLLHRGNNHHGWKGGLPKCINCGKELSSRLCKRCVLCNAKIKGLKGKQNPMFGKKPRFYRFKYKKHLMRSSWEVLLAIWLDFSNIKWLYEPKTFHLESMNYTPDFYLPEFDIWIEVKGWWRANDKTKVKKAQKIVHLKVFTHKELIKYLGVSRFLLEKSKETWLENYKFTGELIK